MQCAHNCFAFQTEDKGVVLKHVDPQKHQFWIKYMFDRVAWQSREREDCKAFLNDNSTPWTPRGYVLQSHSVFRNMLATDDLVENRQAD